MSDRDEMHDQEGGEGPRSRFGGGAPAGGGRPGPGGRPAGGRSGGPRRGGGGGGGRFGGRRKVCGFCVDNIDEVDYKDIARLRRYVSERGKIEPRRKLGTCARHQRSLTVAIKRARHVALLPFTTASR
ncbi:MAG: 30S ribosomal protein S18 [Chloroflexia bacterium]|nr:30S ribosomal protein S18 [Chloroflexia bacterium]